MLRSPGRRAAAGSLCLVSRTLCQPYDVRHAQPVRVRGWHGGERTTLPLVGGDCFQVGEEPCGELGTEHSRDRDTQFFLQLVACAREV